MLTLFLTMQFLFLCNEEHLKRAIVDQCKGKIDKPRKAYHNVSTSKPS